MLKHLIVLLVTLVACASQPAAAATTWRPCKTESDHHCVFDAKHIGNGQGRSFVAYGKHEPVLYVSHRQAHRMLHRG